MRRCLPSALPLVLSLRPGSRSLVVSKAQSQEQGAFLVGVKLKGKQRCLEEERGGSPSTAVWSQLSPESPAPASHPSQPLPGQIRCSCPGYRRVCSSTARPGPLCTAGSTSCSHKELETLPQRQQGGGGLPGAGLVLEKPLGRGWYLLTCRRLLRNRRGPSLRLKRHLEAATAHEKLKHSQPRTEGERKKEQRLWDPQPAAPGESSPPAFKDTQQAQVAGAAGAAELGRGWAGGRRSRAGFGVRCRCPG